MSDSCFNKAGKIAYPFRGIELKNTTSFGRNFERGIALGQSDINGSAIFLSLCNLGDLMHFSDKWRKQHRVATGKPKLVTEAMILKFMRDFALSLDKLHNSTETCNVHSDLMPDNILIMTPPAHRGTHIPELPDFNITDFVRITDFPAPEDKSTPQWGYVRVCSPRR
jgi:serine/threonine protein kinase